MCSSEVNFYFLAGRTSIPMLLLAPYSAQTVAAQSIKCHSQGVGSHFTFQAGGVGTGWDDTPAPTDLCQQEAMTHLNPKSCLLSAQHAIDQTWQDTGHQPSWPLPRSKPSTAHGAAEVSPCCSSVTLSALHITQYRGRPEAAVAEKERALRLESCCWARGSPQGRELMVHAALGLAIR